MEKSKEKYTKNDIKRPNNGLLQHAHKGLYPGTPHSIYQSTWHKDHMVHDHHAYSIKSFFVRSVFKAIQANWCNWSYEYNQAVKYADFSIFELLEFVWKTVKRNIVDSDNDGCREHQVPVILFVLHHFVAEWCPKNEDENLSCDIHKI